MELSGIIMSQEVRMKQSRFTETQIVSILEEADAGRQVKDLCRERKLPRQADRLKVEFPASHASLKTAGGTLPSASWGRSSLYSCIHSQVISRT